MTLATLAMVKAKLDLPPSDTSLDLAISNVLDAASAHVKAETGYDDAATVRTEYLASIPYDGWYNTSFRPVNPVGLAVSARSFGDATWTAISVDLYDAAQGRIKFVAGLTPWDPTDDGGEHEVVKVVYTTAPAVPSDIVDAVAELAAYWFREHRANAASVSIGLASESYLNLPVPPVILSILWRHKRRIARWA